MASKTSKKATKATAEDEDDDLLAGKADKKVKKVPAKKAAAKKTAKKASADDVDEILEGKGAAAKGNGKAKPGKAKARKAPGPRAEDIADTDDVKKALLKYKKPTSYGDIQAATGFNIRQIRRTARAMRDNGELELTKEGTQVLVARA